ncbi:uncharacterized protein LOC105389276 [Plutella xylostella]|uniref:uncharacterized protein LOC105389276 n=1 Tax=Plutella xylostella TaxID=51655 RepID=UPI002032DD57|nr:uncharacterized protein LOC105389276 [Plutella xylostella]XP_048487233.1 uncharacterized protein LOC105389276 [Plutella xylostella]
MKLFVFVLPLFVVMAAVLAQPPPRFRRKLDDADHYRPRGGVLTDDEVDPPECTDEYCEPPTHPPRAPAARRQGNGCPFDYCPPTVHPRSKIYIKLNAQQFGGDNNFDEAPYL